MEEVKEHPYVLQSEEAKPLIVETLKFMYDLDIISPTSGEVIMHGLYYIPSIDPIYMCLFACHFPKS